MQFNACPGFFIVGQGRMRARVEFLERGGNNPSSPARGLAARALSSPAGFGTSPDCPQVFHYFQAALSFAISRQHCFPLFTGSIVFRYFTQHCLWDTVDQRFFAVRESLFFRDNVGRYGCL